MGPDLRCYFFGGALDSVLGRHAEQFAYLRGQDSVRKSAILKFFVVAVTFYGMSTFEGPLLSLRSVNALSHNTDWTIGHVHSGALGWVGFMMFGMVYWLIPKLYKRELYSQALANFHFWIATIGIVIYAVTMWITGIMQGSMWFQFNADGYLVYQDWMEIIGESIPYYYLRVSAELCISSARYSVPIISLEPWPPAS